ncbi:AaceriADL040Wp [[Ashbya] aceris (nom. inval.)]|nr:AaceriADL040Wp [[Ashbya] aceris (nom. inval.)]
MYLPSRIDNIPAPGARLDGSQATLAPGLAVSGSGCSVRAVAADAHYRGGSWPCGGGAMPRSCGLHSSHACTSSRVTLPPLASLLQSTGYMGFHSSQRALAGSSVGVAQPEGDYAGSIESSTMEAGAVSMGRQNSVLPLSNNVMQALPPKALERYAAGSHLRHPVLPVPRPAASSRYDMNKICPVCGRRCTRPSTLKTHMLIHTGELPFQCSWPGCSKRFNVRSNMNRHVNSHKRRLMKENKKKSGSPGAGTP